MSLNSFGPWQNQHSYLRPNWQNGGVIKDTDTSHKVKTEAIHNAFDKLDTDGDGSLSRKEINNAVNNLSVKDAELNDISKFLKTNFNTLARQSGDGTSISHWDVDRVAGLDRNDAGISTADLAMAKYTAPLQGIDPDFYGTPEPVETPYEAQTQHALRLLQQADQDGQLNGRVSLGELVRLESKLYNDVQFQQISGQDPFVMHRTYQDLTTVRLLRENFAAIAGVDGNATSIGGYDLTRMAKADGDAGFLSESDFEQYGKPNPGTGWRERRIFTDSPGT